MKLLLDECITPKGTRVGWDIGRGVDVTHVNQRGLSLPGDAEIWQIACHEGRAIVTVNSSHFLSMAEAGDHYGLFLMPSGYCRQEQLNCIKAICQFLADQDSELQDLTNRIFCVDDHGVIELGDDSSLGAIVTFGY